MEKYKQSIELSDLISGNLRGELSEKEQERMRELSRLLTGSEEPAGLWADPEQWRERLETSAGLDAEKSWKAIRPAIRRRGIAFSHYLSAAAAVLLLLAAGIWLYHAGRLRAPAPEIIVDAFFEPNKTILELPAGERVALDTAADVVNILNHHGILLSPGNQLDYSGKSGLKTPEYHRIIVPRGGEYSLLLEDGTKVWLFAESEIRFPAKFCHSCREVFLSGEAFLEVKHDPGRPFTVKTRSLDVRVLGTCFNVKAYDNDEFVETALVEGVVAIREEVLSPDTRAVFDIASGEIAFEKINGNNYLLRKERMFIFEGERLDDILREMARWYDFTIFYQNPGIADRRFGLKLEKYENVDSLFRLLEKTGEVKFELNEKTLVVKEGE